MTFRAVRLRLAENLLAHKVFLELLPILGNSPRLFYKWVQFHHYFLFLSRPVEIRYFFFRVQPWLVGMFYPLAGFVYALFFLENVHRVFGNLHGLFSSMPATISGNDSIQIFQAKDLMTLIRGHTIAGKAWSGLEIGEEV